MVWFGIIYGYTGVFKWEVVKDVDYFCEFLIYLNDKMKNDKINIRLVFK